MDERCDLLCIDAPRAGAIRGGLLGVEAAGEAGWAMRFTEFIVAERSCGPFFVFELVFEAGEGDILLRVKGPGETKQFISEAFSVPSSRGR